MLAIVRKAQDREGCRKVRILNRHFLGRAHKLYARQGGYLSQHVAHQRHLLCRLAIFLPLRLYVNGGNMIGLYTKIGVLQLVEALQEQSRTSHQNNRRRQLNHYQVGSESSHVALEEVRPRSDNPSPISRGENA